MIFYTKHILLLFFVLNFISSGKILFLYNVLCNGHTQNIKCLFSIFVSVLCIKCWNCRSNNDPKCADPFDNSTVPITDCKQEKGLPHLPGIRPSMCRKIRQKGILANYFVVLFWTRIKFHYNLKGFFKVNI